MDYELWRELWAVVVITGAGLGFFGVGVLFAWVMCGLLAGPFKE